MVIRRADVIPGDSGAGVPEREVLEKQIAGRGREPNRPTLADRELPFTSCQVIGSCDCEATPGSRLKLHQTCAAVGKRVDLRCIDGTSTAVQAGRVDEEAAAGIAL
ncbi:MAG: hypothetical protein JW395_1398 [Nitrospira sp.]|nr:hypothetical protein [Nitrospira sp.]